MAKKSLGKTLALVGLGVVATAVVSYIIKYKEFENELDDDFLEFEDDVDEEDVVDNKNYDRNYIALNADKDSFVLAAKDTASAAMGMASAAKDIIKDVGSIILDNAGSATDIASSKAKIVFDKKQPDINSENADNENYFTDAATDGNYTRRAGYKEEQKDIQENSDNLD